MNAATPVGGTSLHWAAAQGFEELIDILLDNKVLLNVRNNYQQTPLIIALIGGHESCIEKLLKRRADVSLKDTQHKDALDYAKSSGASDRVVSLINKSIEKTKKPN